MLPAFSSFSGAATWEQLGVQGVGSQSSGVKAVESVAVQMHGRQVCSQHPTIGHPWLL